MGSPTIAAIGGDEPPPKHDGRRDGAEEVADGSAEAPAAAARTEHFTGRKSGGSETGGRVAPDEEDLDEILAEIDQASACATLVATAAPAGTTSTPFFPASEPAATDAARAVEDGDADEMDGEVATESAAAKRRKRKKEKERKAAAKADVKKPPKHVQEMLEALARRKEAEERRQHEEEQRKRKADEERLRRQEVERMAEEAKKQKTGRVKEKQSRKMLNGKAMTRKQKEEAKRLEATRRQLLGQRGIPIGGGGAPDRNKRPIYDSKKKRLKPGKTSDDCGDHEQELNEVIKEEQSNIMKAEETLKLDQEIEGGKLINVNQDDEEDDIQWDDKFFSEDDDYDVNLTDTIDFEGEAKAEKKVAIEPVIQKVVCLDAGLKSSETEDGDNADKNGEDIRGSTLKSDPAKVDTDKKDMVLCSPICCILGHVETGKTKLLDCIRGTDVQGGEAGGITQQIGATYFPVEKIREATKELKADAALHVPGLLVIDTPGHESFSNLRSRGSSLCDIAILVVDIMHGIQSQTIESLKLLKKHRIDLIVALNKVDRLFSWKNCPNAPIKKALKQQTEDVKREFDARLTDIVTQFKIQGINTVLYYQSKKVDDTFKNIVPTCAISGEGIPDLLLLSVQWAQKKMKERLTFCEKVECTVLDVKLTEGHGTTIDVVLANGVLHEGDKIVISGMQGPIETHIRALLTPHPMRELRIKKPNVGRTLQQGARLLRRVAGEIFNRSGWTSLGRRIEAPT
ncbi:eukaryotic translation initiation factor 5B isoform X2 [Brachypodium distachyon]|uniref:eukaryotic translation initiation factor 5B isoform X2 n=1 Tax=Brachypodium distachyon TaxID=15368 RepID=UPI00071D2D61|nr:eukaryotic translation initiation factor 5B isoform X2 [Brachypodium distachyon]|eukprot:XP_014754461.1 eukaryotic translation initiation factor 5B isoform X2 [Brachypodium distachyon]